MLLKGHKIIVLLVAAVAAALFAFWAVTGASTLEGLISAALSCALFALVLMRFSEHALHSLSQEELPSPDAHLGLRTLRRDARHPWPRLILFMILSRIALFVLAYAADMLINGYSGGIFDTMGRLWLKTDSPSYLGIAENWYVTTGDPRFHIVFFPFYPLVIRAFNYILNNTFASAMLVSSLSAVAACILLYELAALDLDKRAALRAVKYAFILPGAFFFSAPMTESLFLALSLACIYLTRKKRYLWAAAFGALAAFTRSVGVLLIVVMAMEALHEFLRARRLTGQHAMRAFLLRLLCAALVGLGLVGYLYVNLSVTGNAFTFMRYQSEHWNQGFGFFFASAAYQLEYAIRAFLTSDAALMLELWIPNLLCSFGALVIMAFSIKRIRASYGAYFIAYFAITIGVQWLLSAPRYLSACFPIAFALSALTERRRSDIVATCICLIGLAVYLVMYVNGSYVY